MVTGSPSWEAQSIPVRDCSCIFCMLLRVAFLWCHARLLWLWVYCPYWQGTEDDNSHELLCQKNGSATGEAEAAAGKPVKWKFFKSLFFLKDVLGRKEDSNIEDVPQCSNSSLQDGPSNGGDACLAKDVPQDSPSCNATPSPPLSPVKNHQWKKKRQDDSGAILEDLSAVSCSLVQQKGSHQRFADYCAYLMEYVPSHLVRRCEQEVIRVINTFADGGCVYAQELV
ncbi:uncharacterized protein LOC135386984 isoform X3 [Ornithodoros turicata]|uniref:uncharacterized protein LOC135386984 isoform X3 n=1 Tax=Ornithodoros turicata TaxID=34597 RepID=UPI00313894F1